MRLPGVLRPKGGGVTPEQKQKKKEYDRQRYLTNREAILAATKAWQAKNPGKVLEIVRRWQEANPDKVRRAQAKWQEKHPECARRNAQNYRAQNPEKTKEATRRWRASNYAQWSASNRLWKEKNPDKVKATTHNRRRAPGRLSAVDIAAIMTEPCAYCGAPAEHLEHCTPVSRGGWNVVENCVAACARCNQAKCKKTVLEFLGLWPRKNDRTIAELTGPAKL